MNRIHLGGFEHERGEHTVQGDPRIYGVNPQPGPLPIGPAPPFIRQVISVFDSRPIGGYDFVLSDTFNPYLELPRAEVVSPKGYISIVRRIEVEASPGFVLPEAQLWRFAANGVVAIGWEWAGGLTLTERGIDTFFVVPPSTPYTLIAVTGFTGIAAGSVNVIVRFIGNLILDSNEPPNEQVGSLPHTVIPIERDI